MSKGTRVTNRQLLQTLIDATRELERETSGEEAIDAAMGDVVLSMESVLSRMVEPNGSAVPTATQAGAPVAGVAVGHSDTERLDFLNACDSRALASIFGMTGDGNDVRGQID